MLFEVDLLFFWMAKPQNLTHLNQADKQKNQNAKQPPGNLVLLVNKINLVLKGIHQLHTL